VSGSNNNYILKVSSTGILSVAVGTGASTYAMGTSTSIGSVSSLTLDTNGNLYMGTTNLFVSKINIFNAGSLSSTIAGTGNTLLGAHIFQETEDQRSQQT
jgi:hypothetical protein